MAGREILEAARRRTARGCERRRRVGAVVFATAAACTPVPSPRGATPGAATRSASLPNPARGARASAAPSVDAAVAPDPLAACRATPDVPLDLGAVFDAKACRVGPDDAGALPRLSHGVAARVEVPREVQSGRTVVIHVVFDNRGDAPVAVTLEAGNDVAWGGLGGPRPPPDVHPTIGFGAATERSSRDFRAWRDDDVTSSAKGGLLAADTGSRRARFVLAPSASAVATVLWQAVGSGKPLAPGRYQVRIDLPVLLADGADADFVWIRVKR